MTVEWDNVITTTSILYEVYALLTSVIISATFQISRYPIALTGLSEPHSSPHPVSNIF